MAFTSGLASRKMPGADSRLVPKEFLLSPLGTLVLLFPRDESGKLGVTKATPNRRLSLWLQPDSPRKPLQHSFPRDATRNLQLCQSLGSSSQVTKLRENLTLLPDVSGKANP